jgi:hypothetical protein
LSAAAAFPEDCSWDGNTSIKQSTIGGGAFMDDVEWKGIDVFKKVFECHWRLEAW